MSGIIQHSSKSNEWFSPELILTPARAVFGGVIELDPASCELANKEVKALEYFTKDDDGLGKEWKARTVFCNPPYGWLDYPGGTSNLEVWTKKMADEYRLGHFEEGILVAKSDTGVGWFERLWEHTICFPFKRIKFNKPGKTKPSTVPHSSVIVYFGEHPGRFVREFKSIGRIPLLVSEAPKSLQKELFAA